MAAVLMDAEGGPEIRQPQIDSALSRECGKTHKTGITVANCLQIDSRQSRPHKLFRVLRRESQGMYALACKRLIRCLRMQQITNLAGSSEAKSPSFGVPLAAAKLL